MADPAEMALLHMVTHDPARTPTLTYFANDDFFITAGSNPTPCAPLASCSSEQPGFNWNHGDFQEQIVRTWLGMVGPGVRHVGRTAAIWSDHTDTRPTVLSLAGLTDDYAHDGRVLFEVLDEHAVPWSLRAHRDTLTELAQAYKAINAPVGALGRETLELATRAVAADDATYAAFEQQISDITARRNELAGRMIALLEGAAFSDTPIDEQEARRLIHEAGELLEAVR